MRSPATLIALADQGLYRAKQQGRNRVMVQELDAYERDSSFQIAPDPSFRPEISRVDA